MRSDSLQKQFPGLQAILFDLDGTLVDTDDVAVGQLANRLRPIAGRHAPRLARWLWMKAETPGNGAIILLDILNMDGPMRQAKSFWQRRRAQEVPHFQLIPGIIETVQAANDKYPLALVTTRGRQHIDHFLANYPRLAAALTIQCGAEDTRRLKPHPAPVQLAASRLNVPVEKCLMVGDTTVDVKSARRAGAWAAGVLCGFGERPELKRAGAHLILESTADLQTLL